MHSDFVFRLHTHVPAEALPKCPSCGQTMGTTNANLAQGHRPGDASPANLLKLVHTCPNCHVILGISSY